MVAVQVWGAKVDGSVWSSCQSLRTSASSCFHPLLTLPPLHFQYLLKSGLGAGQGIYRPLPKGIHTLAMSLHFLLCKIGRKNIRAPVSWGWGKAQQDGRVQLLRKGTELSIMSTHTHGVPMQHLVLEVPTGCLHVPLQGARGRKGSSERQTDQSQQTVHLGLQRLYDQVPHTVGIVKEAGSCRVSQTRWGRSGYVCRLWNHTASVHFWSCHLLAMCPWASPYLKLHICKGG